jgi:hypothetical protein
MNAPLRILKDPSLAAALRADLASVRGGSDVHYDVDAGLDRLRAVLGPSPPHGGGGGAPSSPPPSGVVAIAGGAAVGTIGAKVLIAGIASIGAAVLVVAFVASRPKHESPPNVIAFPPPTATSTVTTKAANANASPNANSSVGTNTTTNASDTADTNTTANPRLPARAATTARPTTNAPSGDDTLSEETANLARLRAAARSDPALALFIANEGNRRFPRGIFGQERESIAIDALARLGRTSEARARARAFLAAYPGGPYAEKVRKVTGLDAPSP